MENQQVREAFSRLSTPLVSDACIRLKVPVRACPPPMGPLDDGMTVSGRVLPSRHRGSVDVFLEAMRAGGAGDVLVIDNGARADESCVGDLTILEAKAWGLSGVVVRGYHRDSKELAAIGFPLFSHGAMPAGPVRLEPRGPQDLLSADMGTFEVSRDDAVFGDRDGVVFVPSSQVGEVLRTAEGIREVERRQADKIRSGTKLSDQLDFGRFLARRESDPGYTFRRHLRDRGGAVEE